MLFRAWSLPSHCTSLPITFVRVTYFGTKTLFFLLSCLLTFSSSYSSSSLFLILTDATTFVWTTKREVLWHKFSYVHFVHYRYFTYLCLFHFKKKKYHWLLHVARQLCLALSRCRALCGVRGEKQINCHFS